VFCVCVNHLRTEILKKYITKLIGGQNADDDDDEGPRKALRVQKSLSVIKMRERMKCFPP